MTKLHNRSLEELHHMLVSKEITVQDLTKATFERRSEEHTSELQSRRYISYAVFCLKKKKKKK
nr:hypothetical protein [Enterococcus faecium]